MSYFPTSAGHEDAPTEQLIVRQTNKLLEQAVEEMRLQLMYRGNHVFAIPTFDDPQHPIGEYPQEIIYAAWNDPRLVMCKNRVEWFSRPPVLADFLARSTDTVVRWHDEMVLTRTAFSKKVVVVESFYAQTIGVLSKDTVFILNAEPSENIGVDGNARNVVINISDVDMPRSSRPDSSEFYIDAGRSSPSVYPLYEPLTSQKKRTGAYIPITVLFQKKRSGNYFQMTGGRIRLVDDEGHPLSKKEFPKEYAAQRKCVYTRSQIKKAGLEEYLQELVGYARHDPEGIPERYGPAPAIGIRQQINDILHAYKQKRGGA